LKKIDRQRSTVSAARLIVDVGQYGARTQPNPADGTALAQSKLGYGQPHLQLDLPRRLPLEVEASE
jgi:hypothetical protein